MFLLEPGNMT